MGFSVAPVLIALGVLNLTGALRWLTERFAPVNHSKTRATANPGIFPNRARNALDRLVTRYGSYQVFRPVVIGFVHGLAAASHRYPQWAQAVHAQGCYANPNLATSNGACFRNFVADPPARFAL